MDANRHPLPPNRVLFACVHNAGRSQIAAALFNLLTDQNKALAISAGTQPAPHMHPEVVDAMGEIGIILSGVRPLLLTNDLAGQATLLITMGCGENCPVIPGQFREEWNVPDPKGQPPVKVREIRDLILRLVKNLIARKDWGGKPPGPGSRPAG